MEIAFSTGLFSESEADQLLGATLRSIHDGTFAAETHFARVVDDADGKQAGWTYLSADEQADGVWELWWIGVSRTAEGHGFGAALLADAEEVAASHGARMLLISTSSTAATARARSLYERQGYVIVGTVPDFYGPGDDKVMYWKRMTVVYSEA